jgi:hypothetical protein
MGRPGITLDTGALIAFERRGKRITAVINRALEDDLVITVPAAVLVEWWRGQPSRIAKVLDAVEVEELTERLARVAGEALASVKAPNCPRCGAPRVGFVDAIVMGSAAQRGDHVYTSDVGDLELLKEACFPAVRVFKA